MKSNNYYDTRYKLCNGAIIASHNGIYDFLYEDRIILASCQNFSYLSGKIIVLKKDEKIIVYSTKIIEENGIKTVQKLLEFIAHSKIAYGKIICEKNMYLIDGNCQIKYSCRPHIN